MVLAVLAGPTSLLGLDPKTPLNQYGHDTWDGDSGLPQNTVTAIVQTKDGYVWFGTQEGLVRFDGVGFSIFDTRNTKAMNDDWVQVPVRDPGRDPLDRDRHRPHPLQGRSFFGLRRKRASTAP